MNNLAEYERQKAEEFIISYQGKLMHKTMDLKDATETFHRYFHGIPTEKIHNLKFTEGGKEIFPNKRGKK